MKLAFDLLDDVQSVNSFRHVTEFAAVEGQTDKLYMRLVQIKDGGLEETDSKLRYIPIVGATFKITFEHIDDARVTSRMATMLYPDDDRSIFVVTILPGEKLANNSLKGTLTEGSSVKTLLCDTQFTTQLSDNNRYYC